MKYYILTGEASGDLHGSNLVKALREKDTAANIMGWGGDLMEAQGVRLVKHIKDLAFMGFAEVILNLRTIFNNFAFCKKDILSFQPDVLVLVDYPGFNLRMAIWAKKNGFKVVYYISPQVWAWKASRVKKMKHCIDELLVILPFEAAYFENKWQWKVTYVGHPLVEVVDNFIPKLHNISDKPIVALLPGSRRQEIKAKLPIMLQVAAQFPNYHFIVAKAPAIEDAFYRTWLQHFENVSSLGGLTYELLKQAAAALVTSGTATLETALFGVPEVVCYKAHPLSYQIAKRLIKIKYISLVNLIMDKPIVEELIQDQLTVKNLTDCLQALLTNPNKRQMVKSEYAELREKLSEGGKASEQAAERIVFHARRK